MTLFDVSPVVASPSEKPLPAIVESAPVRPMAEDSFYFPSRPAGSAETVSEGLVWTSPLHVSPPVERLVSRLDAVVVGTGDASVPVRLVTSGVVASFPRQLFDSSDSCRLAQPVAYEIWERHDRTRYQRLCVRKDDAPSVSRERNEILAILDRIGGR
jgi:hypothetical protein